MIIKENTEIMASEGKVILANPENGKWMRISEEAYHILKKIVSYEVNMNLLTDSFENEEDFLFMKNVYYTLVDLEILVNSNNLNLSRNRLIGIQLTNRCNLKCIHCCVDADNVDDKGKELSTEEMINTFDKVIKWNPERVMLSGGEPMLRKDFMFLLNYLRENYMGKISLSTNSLLINENNIKNLIESCDNFDISIDGVDEETCSVIRGKGVFGKVCQKVDMIKKHGCDKISLSMVFADKNQHLKKKFYELNRKLGTFPVCRVFSPVGRGEVNKNFFTDLGINDIYLPNEYLVENYCKPFGVTSCSAGYKEIIIACDGTVYPCPNFWSPEYELGNIKNCACIEEIIKVEKGQFTCACVNQMKPQNLPECRECSVRLFCWTCPGAVQEIKSKVAFQKRCEILKPILIERVWNKEINM